MKALVPIEYYVELSKRVKWVDGLPYWIKNMSSNARIGQVAGSINGGGYRIISCSINKFPKNIRASRLHWFMTYNSLPDNIDHINNIRIDDRIENLRSVTPAQNSMNKTSRPNSKSKYVGVTLNMRENRWVAGINISGKRKHIGYFDNEMDAAKARDIAASKQYGEYANLNFDNRDRIQVIEIDIKLLDECIEGINKDLCRVRAKRLLLLMERLKIKQELIIKKDDD